MCPISNKDILKFRHLWIVLEIRIRAPPAFDPVLSEYSHIGIAHEFPTQKIGVAV